MNIETYPWRKSSYSGSGANECVEVAPLDHGTGLRDTKDRARGHLELRPAAWASLVNAIKHG